MKNNLDFIERADLYIKDELSPEDKLMFEKYCDENPQAAEEYDQYRILFPKLREYQLRKDLKRNMESVFSEQGVLKFKEKRERRIGGIKDIWKKYKYTALDRNSTRL